MSTSILETLTHALEKAFGMVKGTRHADKTKHPHQGSTRLDNGTTRSFSIERCSPEDGQFNILTLSSEQNGKTVEYAQFQLMGHPVNGPIIGQQFLNGSSIDSFSGGNEILMPPTKSTLAFTL